MSQVVGSMPTRENEICNIFISSLTQAKHNVQFSGWSRKKTIFYSLSLISLSDKTKGGVEFLHLTYSGP